MPTGTFLLILADLITLMKTKGLITADGAVVVDFANFTTDADLAAGVEAICVAHGVAIPDKVKAALQLLPLIAAIVK